MDIDFTGLIPEAILSALAIYLLIHREGRAYLPILFTGLIVTLIVSILLWFRTDERPTYLVSIDHFSLFFNILFILTALVVILNSLGYGKVQEIDLKTYIPIVLFATLGMTILPKATDLLTLFLGLEILSLSLYILAGFKKRDSLSIEAGFKYLILGTFAIAFVLYGVSLLYGAFGTTDLFRISGAIKERRDYLVLFGVALLTFGFGFKIALVPLHMWTPDVYMGAPSPVAAFISTGSKGAVFAIFLKVYLAFSPIRGDLIPPLWILSILSMTVGNIAALLQEDIKRMLAFSSIAHMGYILIALLTFDDLGSSAVLFNLLVYTLMNLGAFGVVTVLSGREGDFARIECFQGLWYRNPWLAGIMSISLLSLAGIPPTAGFIGKFYIFSAAIKAGFLGIVLIGIINSIIALYYYLRVIMVMYTKGTVSAQYPGEERVSRIRLSLPDRIALAIVTVGIVALGIYPGPAIAIGKDVVKKSVVHFL